MAEIVDFESTDQPSQTYQLHSSEIRKNSHIVINGRPGKVTDVETKRHRHHSPHATYTFVAKDIFTGERLDLTMEDGNVNVPIVVKTEYELNGIDDGYMNLATQSGEQVLDIPVPSGDLGKEIKEVADDNNKNSYVTILAAMGEKAVISVRGN